MFCLGTFLCTTHVAVCFAITKSKRPCNQETYHCQCQGAHYQTPSKWSLYCTYVALGVPEYTHTSFRHMRGRKTRLAPHMFFGCLRDRAHVCRTVRMFAGPWRICSGLGACFSRSWRKYTKIQKNCQNMRKYVKQNENLRKYAKPLRKYANICQIMRKSAKI